MTFSNAFHDNSFIREQLANEILAASGVRTSRSSLYRVNFKEGDKKTYLGLYTMIEDPSDQLVKTYPNDARKGKGNLYKPETSTWKTFNASHFEKKSNEDEADFSDIKAAFAALQSKKRLSEDPAMREEWRQELEEVLDVRSFIKFSAVSGVFGHWDSYGTMPHNYYLYNYNDRLTWIPWDHNYAMSNTMHKIPDIMKDEIGDEWYLVRFLLDDPVYREQYYKIARWTLEEGPFKMSDVKTRTHQLMALAKPHIVGGVVDGETVKGEKWPGTILADKALFSWEELLMDKLIEERHKVVKRQLDRELKKHASDPDWGN